jgi:hypothetical protein
MRWGTLTFLGQSPLPKLYGAHAPAEVASLIKHFSLDNCVSWESLLFLLCKNYNCESLQFCPSKNYNCMRAWASLQFILDKTCKLSNKFLLEVVFVYFYFLWEFFFSLLSQHFCKSYSSINKYNLISFYHKILIHEHLISFYRKKFNIFFFFLV